MNALDMLLLILQQRSLIFSLLTKFLVTDVRSNVQKRSFIFLEKSMIIARILARDDPQSLVILLNEEIVVIDLVTDSWPLYHLPYLNSIHASPVICTSIAYNVNPQFYKKLVNYAAIQFDDYSDRVC